MKTIKRSSTLIRSLFVGAAIAASGASHAALIDQPVPDSLIVDRNGLEWVWALPVAADGGDFGASAAVELNWGFRLATEAEWLASFTGLTDLFNAFNPVGGNPICASAYFSNIWDKCDPIDIYYGNVWGAPFASDPTNPYAETFLVRGVYVPPSGVPLPATPFLLGAGLAALGLSRRKRSA